ncbi:thiamine pyrophosphate-dependent dehydrogenase E1 component subunit alpha [Alteromonas sp. LMIT006]|uniref:thiamine pyrophosphate-dependent dehydrogenase E1 component subunit alpha n=1 Tax=Alteromonadaceae TaxID=72275 RepID=UPI0020CA61A8|nr:thiamine pyrophosphate-dependent dehydrogenase E1 component subunit alpha [Alteromonas sp. LMIT006]UTP72136.1 thiamine pyrophosphate-dependent dehydrogenase E1 component subunit alpha [Alteromonas sp. LMIT006]
MSEITQSTAKNSLDPVSKRDHMAQISATQAVNLINKQSAPMPMLQLLNSNGDILNVQYRDAWDKDTAMKLFYAMHFTRILDERMVGAQRQGRISFYLACTGEEAAIVGATAGVEMRDMIMTQYREQGALAYRGYTAIQFMNQMFSNALDPNKGRQMPIHYGDKALNFMTVSSPLGTQIPQAAGYAYGQKMSGEDAITLCFFGEGAASEGDFHAGLNMAAVLECPCIFLCRNNGYAISTPADEQFKGDGIASRGIGYGVHTIRVDGNDALAMFVASKEARTYALKHNCPVLIEAMTYRLAAHSTSDDPSGYRSRDEEALWREKDPIMRMHRYLQHVGWLDEKALDGFITQTRSDLLAAVKFAEKQAIAPLAEIVTDVYAQVEPHLQDQLDALQMHVNKYPEAYPKTSQQTTSDEPG